jgi:hypothetical protein
MLLPSVRDVFILFLGLSSSRVQELRQPIPRRQGACVPPINDRCVSTHFHRCDCRTNTHDTRSIRWNGSSR